MAIWRKLAIGIAVVAISTAGAGYAGRRDLHGWALVFRAANGQGVLRRLADIDTVPVEERLVDLPVRDGSLRARIYEPLTIARQTVLLVSGLHPAGIDEPRLIDLARKLAEANVVVVTPDIPELSRFEVTPVVTRRIEETAVWLATASGLAPAGRHSAITCVLSFRSVGTTTCCVYFLLHGRDDTVIPSSEAQFLAVRLRGRAPTRLLVSDLLSHANADQPTHVTSIWSLAHFWGDVLSR